MDKGIKAAGYATAPDYVSSIENVIKSNGLRNDPDGFKNKLLNKEFELHLTCVGDRMNIEVVLFPQILARRKNISLVLSQITFSLPMNTNNMIVTSEKEKET